MDPDYKCSTEDKELFEKTNFYIFSVEQKSFQHVTMNDSRFLALPLDARNLTQQLNLQLLEKKNFLKVDDMTTKLAVVDSTQVIESVVLNR